MRQGRGSNVNEQLDERAKFAAMGTIRKSAKTYLSQAKLFYEYCKVQGLDNPFDISLELLCRYLAIFKNGYSAEKYLQAISWVFTYCHRPKAELDILHHPAVKQIIRGNKKDNVVITTPPVIWFLFSDSR